MSLRNEFVFVLTTLAVVAVMVSTIVGYVLGSRHVIETAVMTVAEVNGITTIRMEVDGNVYLHEAE